MAAGPLRLRLRPKRRRLAAPCAEAMRSSRLLTALAAALAACSPPSLKSCNHITHHDPHIAHWQFVCWLLRWRRAARRRCQSRIKISTQDVQCVTEWRLFVADGSRCSDRCMAACAGFDYDALQ